MRSAQAFPELVVYDEAAPCPYLPDRQARLPHRAPLKELTAEMFDAQLAAGDRRSGWMLYRPQCPACQACEPIRVVARDFAPRATQRRIQRRGDDLLQCAIGRPEVDDERVRLFNRHRRLRGLEQGDGEIDAEGYERFLVDSCAQTIELLYRCQGQLVAVAIADLGRQSLSSVYCFFEPEFRPLSLGTYSVLRQVALCREWGLAHLYLGYYIAPSRHMAYKALFRPHERLVQGEWRRFK